MFIVKIKVDHCEFTWLQTQSNGIGDRDHVWSITHRGIQWVPRRLQYMQTYHIQRNTKRVVAFISNWFFQSFVKLQLMLVDCINSFHFDKQF